MNQDAALPEVFRSLERSGQHAEYVLMVIAPKIEEIRAEHTMIGCRDCTICSTL